MRVPTLRRTRCSATVRWSPGGPGSARWAPSSSSRTTAREWAAGTSAAHSRGRSVARSVALRAVDELADDVQVPVVAGVLLDQVLEDPAERDLPPVAHPLDGHLVEVEGREQLVVRPRHLGVVVERDRQRLFEPVGELLLRAFVPPGHLERLAEEVLVDPRPLHPAQMADDP